MKQKQFDNRHFLIIFICMKFKTLYSLAATMAITLGIGMYSYVKTGDKNIQKQPANTGIKYNCSQISTRTDTIVITEEMLKNRQIIAAGVFMPNSGVIKINYMTTNSENKNIQEYCDRNNRQARLVLRHEMEHARKANLTKNTWWYPPHTRGEIAAQNEIIAPAAEIIEAIDYRSETNQAYPTNRSFIRRADMLITQYANQNKLDWPLDFNNREIANIIIQCATDRFVSEIKRGVYKATIMRAMQFGRPQAYVTNNLCTTLIQTAFLPQYGIWAPMWNFESRRGQVNIWQASSYAQRKKLINTVDSVINEIAGKNSLFMYYTKTR